LYVSVLHENIIPSGEQTDGLSDLRNAPRWNEAWTTLTVRMGPEGVIETTVDEFVPHSFDTTVIGGQDATFVNILELIPCSRISDRVSRVVLDDKSCVLKIARFQSEVPALQQEVVTYAILASRSFSLAPQALGYVYEETRDRTVGFLMEDVLGRTPGEEDLDECQKPFDFSMNAGSFRVTSADTTFL
jgi:hypothetical protein